MIKRENKTAILIFSRTSQEEATQKSFANNIPKKNNERIAQQLINHSIATAKKTQLPVFSTHDSSQIGDSFGERLANEIENIFSKGYESLIAIGNDCPDLNTTLLLEAAQKLTPKNIVLGPSDDGGLYLIAIHSSVYQRSNFINLAWETPNLQAAWNVFGDAIIWLKQLSDIDKASEFAHFFKQTPTFSRLRKILSVLLQNTIFTVEYSFRFALSFYYKINALRAPPFLS